MDFIFTVVLNYYARITIFFYGMLAKRFGKTREVFVRLIVSKRTKESKSIKKSE
jgi:hypothetical protein